MSSKKLYVVDTIVSYRMRYVVEAKEESHALDEVTMIDSGNPDDSFVEFSQKYIDENIIDSKEITKEQFYELLEKTKKDSRENCSSWMGEDLIRKIRYVDPK